MCDSVSDSVIFVSVVDVVSSLKPLSPHLIVLNLHLSSFPLRVCMLNLWKVSVLVLLHSFSAYGHVRCVGHLCVYTQGSETKFCTISSLRVVRSVRLLANRFVPRALFKSSLRLLLASLV